MIRSFKISEEEAPKIGEEFRVGRFVGKAICLIHRGNKEVTAFMDDKDDDRPHHDMIFVEDGTSYRRN